MCMKWHMEVSLYEEAKVPESPYAEHLDCCVNVGAATFKVRADTSGRGPEDGSRTSTVTEAAEKSEVDRLIEGISFGQLCDEFECISSPAVERTARQLVKDIMDIREGQRSLSNFGVNVKYKVRCIDCH